MIWLSHPTGNTFVRALLAELERSGGDYEFFTTLAMSSGQWWSRCLPRPWGQELGRRRYAIPARRCHQRPARELGRLLAARLGRAPWGNRHGFSVDAIYRDLDGHIAKRLARQHADVRLVYGYEDGACETFRRAHQLGVRCAYELPILYWEASRALLLEEAVRWPAWAETLGAPADSAEKCARKTEELQLAQVVVCPSQFVLRSLPEPMRRTKSCVVAEFGSPPPDPAPRAKPCGKSPLRLLFVGTLTQRKGLADLFAAMRLLHRPDVELVLLGTPVLPREFYRQQWSSFTYEPPRAHAAVLELMRTCDVLVLPSIVEGRALVQHEALSCGLPLLITPNTGGEDLIVDGQTGFLVPVRDPQALAEKIDWLADHRVELEAMREAARAKAAEFSWERYGQRILQAVGQKEVR